MGEAVARVQKTRCADLPPPGGAWRRKANNLKLDGNQPAILTLHNIAIASRALPGSKVSRLKVAIVHKVTWSFNHVTAIGILGQIKKEKSS